MESKEKSDACERRVRRAVPQSHSQSLSVTETYMYSEAHDKPWAVKYADFGPF